MMRSSLNRGNLILMRFTVVLVNRIKTISKSTSSGKIALFLLSLLNACLTRNQNTRFKRAFNDSQKKWVLFKQ